MNVVLPLFPYIFLNFSHHVVFVVEGLRILFFLNFFGYSPRYFIILVL